MDRKGAIGRRAAFGVSAIAVAGLLALAAPLQAAENGVGRSNSRALSASGGDPFWTPERFRAARPLNLPGADPEIVEDNATAARNGVAAGPQVSWPSSPPKLELAPNWNNRLFTPSPLGQLSPQLDGVIANGKGSSGFPYTTSRVLPDAAVSAYPYRAAGKIFFRDPRKGTLNICSGAVISKRLVGTAGHCVYNTAGNYWYDNFQFIPAYRNGAAPYKKWTWGYVWTTNTWINGGETFPNRGDFAIIETADNGGVIGNITGTLGWITNAMVGQHLHTLGYPGNIDNGERMQFTAAETRSVSGGYAGQLGSEQRGGSSGGPWVRDLGVTGSGSDLTPAGMRNRIVGFTSYGPVAIGPKYQGSTILNGEWTSLWNSACRRKSGNC
jgi:V8-like Glu-specific endopeptidase